MPLAHYIPRILEPYLKIYLHAFPVVALTGPRQSGKSTLLQHVLSDYTYLTFDDPLLIQEFDEDPIGFLKRYPSKIIFDEAQRVPKLFHYIKIYVDRNRENYGQFVLSGSAQFSLIQSITESLAGRIGLLTLLPLQLSEMPQNCLEESIYRGSYPEQVKQHYLHWKFWYSSYFSSYITRDVRLLSNIGDIHDFQRFVYLLAANTAQILNMSSYAHDLGVSVATIKRWISILEASYLIFLLQPFYTNLGKRLVKSPKVYFYDTGLVCYLTGLHTQESYAQGPMAGSVFENYIIAEIIKKSYHTPSDKRFFYARTSNGLEIDLIIDAPEGQEWIEIKNTSSFKSSMLKPMITYFENDALKNIKTSGTLIYRHETRRFNDAIMLYNYQEYLQKM